MVARRRLRTVPRGDDVIADDVIADDELADLRSLYDRHCGLVHRICRKALDPHAADEVTQDVFVRAWQRRDQFDPERGTVRTWLIGITKRRIIDHLRSEGRHAGRRNPELVEATDALGEVGLDRTIDRMVVADALSAVPQRARTVIALAYIDGLTHNEISERTGLALGTVKSDIRRGLDRIRDHMEKHDE